MNTEQAAADAMQRIKDFINRSAGQHIRQIRNSDMKQEANARTVNVMRLHGDAQLPSYATNGAACFDLRASLGEDVVSVAPGAQAIVGTGLAFEVPVGYVMNVVSRSGHSANARVSVTNSPGKIDCDYRGEVKIILRNDGRENFIVRHGDRIAQAEIVECPRWGFVFVSALSSTQRGTGGFGSTGK